MRTNELAFVGVFLLVLGAVFLLDRAIPSTERSTQVADEGPFLSAGWYCPAPPGEGIDAVMSSANLGRSPLGLRRLAVGGSKQSQVEQANLDSLRRSSVSLGQFQLADSAGVTEAFGEASTTELSVRARGKGVAISRCSPQPWDKWFFSYASTTRGEDHYLLVANPFEEEAVVRVRLMSPEQDTVPALLRNLVIPTLSQVAVFLPDYFVETPSFGIEATATTGRVVVSRYSALARGGVRGISLDVGVREPAIKWTFAGGEVPDDGEESIVLVNPEAREALVEIVFPTDTERVAPPDLAELPVPPGRQVTVNVGDHLPKGTKHGIIITSTNSVPLISERRTSAEVSGGRGYEAVFGVPSPSRVWVVPVGSEGGGSASLAVVNPGQAAIKARVSLISDKGQARPPELASVAVEAGRRATVDLGPHLGGGVATALVEATGGSIAVESSLTLGPPYSDFAASPGQALR